MKLRLFTTERFRTDAIGPVFLVAVWLVGLGAPRLAAGQSYGEAKSEGPELTRSLRVVDSLRTAREFGAALRLLSKLDRAHPETPEVLWRYSLLWSDYGKAMGDDRALSAQRQALAMADRALAAGPENAWAHLARAVAAGRAALLEPSNRTSVELSREVKDHADRAIELDDTLAPAYHVRGTWHSEMASLGFLKRTIVRTAYGGLPSASYQAAVDDLTRALTLEARTYTHLELGRAYLKMGRREAAREQLRKALDAPLLDPFAPEYKLEARALLHKLE